MRNISKKAWYLIVVSAIYFIAVVACTVFQPFKYAIEIAQLLYVIILSLPLVFSCIGKRIGVKSYFF